MAKREENAQRREKDREAKIESWMARYLALQIVDGRDRKNHSKFDALLGKFLCTYDENYLPECLRIAADILEEKPAFPHHIFLRYNPGRNWYDGKIKLAWLEASRPHLEKMLSRGDSPKVIAESLMMAAQNRDSRPSFSEVVLAFRKQNANLKTSSRSLRRALQRLRLITRPGSPGRPKKK